MHTVMVMAGGFALLAICLLIGCYTGSIGKGALVFIPLWLIGAAINMWIGVNRAGYSYADEFPIFLLILSVPAAIAGWLWWRGFRSSDRLFAADQNAKGSQRVNVFRSTPTS